MEHQRRLIWVWEQSLLEDVYKNGKDQDASESRGNAPSVRREESSQESE